MDLGYAVKILKFFPVGIAARLRSRYTVHPSLAESGADSQMDENDNFPQHFCIAPSSFTVSEK